MTVKENAQKAYAIGLQPMSVRHDGSKAPRHSWKDNLSERFTLEETLAMFEDNDTGMGVICGEVSGFLELFEFEGRFVHSDAYEEFLSAVEDAGLGDVLRRVRLGYEATSPSGGVHLLFRTQGPSRSNLKLARRPSLPEELEVNPAQKVQTLIETRGQGGFTILAGSNGKVHPSGGAWKLRSGKLPAIATITCEERDALYDIAGTFDEMPARPEVRPELVSGGSGIGLEGTGSVDELQEYVRTEIGVSELLVEDGWTLDGENRRTGEQYWIRPGKSEGEGHGASLFPDGGFNIYTSTREAKWDAVILDGAFDHVTPLGALAAVRFDGDISAAMSWVRRQMRPPEPPSEMEVEAIEAEMTPGQWLAAQMVTPAQLALRPRPTYLIDKHVPDGTNVFIIGPSGVGKSFLALDWALKVATGGGIWGDGHDVRGGRVLYVAAEGSGGLSKRIEAWQKYYHVTEEPDLLVLDRAVSLFKPTEVDMLVEAVELTGPFDMIVIDTLARSMTGGDENSATDAGIVINSFDRLRRVAGEAAMVVIHHTGKDAERGARGSSAYYAAVDAEILVTGKVTGIVKTSTTKMKDDEDGIVTQLKGRIIELDDGPGIGADVPTSVVLVQLDAEEVAVIEGDYKAIDPTTPAGEHDRVVAFMRNQGKAYSKNALLGELRENDMGLRATRLNEILALGEQRGEIEQVKVGNHNRYRATNLVEDDPE